MIRSALLTFVLSFAILSLKAQLISIREGRLNSMGTEVTLTGILSTYYDNPQVLVREYGDLVLSSSIWLTTPLTVSNITTQGFDLEWTTNIKGSTVLRYGNTPDLELNPLEGTGDSTWHFVSISGTDPSELFYAQAISVTGNDTAWSNVNAYITKSNSSGMMKAYFNRTVDLSVSTGTDAVYLHHSLGDTLTAYIDRAKHSIDLAIYRSNTNGIADITASLNAAHNRGLQVRIVADWNTEDKGRWASLDPDIGIMHNKFLIINAMSPDPDDPYVWTGSTNFTEDQLKYHDNNVIIIQDQSLANVYRIEFEEMFGSSGPQPDPTAAKFGASKEDNTPAILEVFSVNGRLIWSEETEIVAGENPISLPQELSRGLYILQLRHEDGTERTKLMIQ